MSDDLGQKFITSRLNTISKIRELADEIDQINKRSKIALLSGTSASILGGIVGVPLAIAAIVMTGGAVAVPLGIAAGVFGGLGATGGMTSFGAGLGGHFHIKAKYQEAIEAVEIDIELGKEFVNGFKIARGVVSAVGGTTSIIKGTADIAGVAVKAGDAALDTAAAAARVSRIAGGVGIAVGILLLPLDIYILVKNSKDILTDKRHEKAEQLREVANDLEQSMEDLRNFVSSTESESE